MKSKQPKRARKGFNVGIRMTDGEVTKLGELQSYARVNKVKVSDSHCLRALAKAAAVDGELAELVRKVRDSSASAKNATSINWKRDGLAYVDALIAGLTEMDSRLGVVSLNDIARALIAQASLEGDDKGAGFLGVLRASLESERAEKVGAR